MSNPNRSPDASPQSAPLPKGIIAPERVPVAEIAPTSTPPSGNLDNYQRQAARGLAAGQAAMLLSMLRS